MTSSIHERNKVNAIKTFPLTRTRRMQSKDALRSIERSSFMSVSSSIEWQGNSSSLFCAFYSSYLKQKLSIVKVSTLIFQTNAQQTLEKLETVMFYLRPSPSQHQVSVILFSDASRSTDHGQLALKTGNLICCLL